MQPTRGLGKGIRALIPERGLQTLPVEIQPDSPATTSGTSRSERQESVIRVPLGSIRPNRFQPRKNLDEIKVQELANSIKESGLIYPLLVRKTDKSGLDGPYELIAGERRLRALRLLGHTEAPVIIKELVDDRKALELSLLENIQREELNPIEEAQAFQLLSSEFGLTQEQIAVSVGKDRATVGNTLRLLKLSAPVKEELIQKHLTLGHARALLGIESEKAQWALTQRIVAQGLSVRQVEQIVQGTGSSRKGRPRLSQLSDPHLAAVEQRLRRTLGTNVQILPNWKGGTAAASGWVRIAYYSLKDLDRVITRLASSGTLS